MFSWQPPSFRFVFLFKIYMNMLINNVNKNVIERIFNWSSLIILTCISLYLLKYDMILWTVASQLPVNYNSINNNCSEPVELVQNDVEYWISESNYFFSNVLEQNFANLFCFFFHFEWSPSLYFTLSIVDSTILIRFMDNSSKNCNFFDQIPVDEGNTGSVFNSVFSVCYFGIFLTINNPRILF